MKRDLIYPFFIECCGLTTDKFWKGIFEDLAYGVAPYGAYILRGAIICNYKDKEFMYRIVKKDPAELYNEIYNLFTAKLNVMSKEQILQQKEDMERTQESATDWAAIKKKNIKDVLLANWALNMKNKHRLSLPQTRYILSIMFLGLIFKVFTSKDIIIKNGCIEEINGIRFSEGKVHIERDIYDIPYTPSPETVTFKTNMSDQWDRYVQSLTNKQI